MRSPRPSYSPASCCPKGRFPLLGVRSPRSPSFPASCCPEGRFRLLGARSPRPCLSLPAAVPKGDSRCLACAPRALTFPCHLGLLTPCTSFRIPPHLHSATQNRATQPLPCTRTQSSGPITDLKLIKSRGCSCTSAVQPCSLETPAALLLYNMLSGAALNCFPIHMCTTILMTNFPCSFTLGVALFSFLPSCVSNLFAQFSTIPPSPRPVPSTQL